MLKGKFEFRRIVREDGNPEGRGALCFAHASDNFSNPVRTTLLWIVTYGPREEFEDLICKEATASACSVSHHIGYGRYRSFEGIADNRKADLVEEEPIKPPRCGKNYGWVWDCGRWEKRFNYVKDLA